MWFYYSLFTKCTSSLNLIDDESTLLISYFVNKPTYTGYRYFIINKNDEQKKNIEQQLYKDTENSFAMKKQRKIELSKVISQVNTNIEKN